MSKSKVNLTPDQISSKWNQNMKQSIPFIQQGIDSVTESPMEKAASAKDKMLQNLTESVNNGKWEAGLRKVTLGDWKQKTKAKVAQRLAQGVDGAMNKRKAFDSWLVNKLNSVLPTISQMPDMTLQDSLNRVQAMMEAMHNDPYKQ